VRALTVLLGRLLVVFLSLEIADVPFICADEGSSSVDSVPADAVFGPVLAGEASVERTAIVDARPDGPATCFCPCHMSFRAASRTELPDSGRSVALVVLPVSSRVSAPSRSLDHPPQNLI